jgi:hypothetical protein
LGVAFALAKDLKKSDFSFLRLDLESVFLRVLDVDVGCGVERPDVGGSEPLSFLAGVAFASENAAGRGFAATFDADLDGAGAGGVYLVVRLCRPVNG